MPAWLAWREGAYSIPALDGRGFKIALDTHGPAFDPETGAYAGADPSPGHGHEH